MVLLHWFCSSALVVSSLLSSASLLDMLLSIPCLQLLCAGFWYLTRLAKSSKEWLHTLPGRLLRTVWWIVLSQKQNKVDVQQHSCCETSPSEIILVLVFYKNIYSGVSQTHPCVFA